MPLNHMPLKIPEIFPLKIKSNNPPTTILLKAF
uniref:Uncharacterized protein n=1 Tax=Rhizophora mucronata TaxID=61149 RepID=A0A2P2NBD4_RHIMU